MKQEAKRIEKLQKLTDIKTFWNDVRKLTKKVNKRSCIESMANFGRITL